MSISQSKCPIGGEHEWHRVDRETEFQERLFPIMRACRKCKWTQRWYMTAAPTPENAPQLGEWRDV